MTVAESQTAQLECEVANPDAVGRWLKEGQPVDLNENVVSEVRGAVRRLVIIITRPQDVGEYSYQVANSKTTANLKVEGKPTDLYMQYTYGVTSIQSIYRVYIQYTCSIHIVYIQYTCGIHAVYNQYT